MAEHRPDPVEEPFLVEPEHACPRCGERRMDWLEFVEDDRVRCTSCGHHYTLE